MIICDTLAIVGILPKPSSPLKPKGKDRLPVSQPSWLSAAKMLVSGRWYVVVVYIATHRVDPTQLQVTWNNFTYIGVKYPQLPICVRPVILYWDVHGT